MAYGLDAPVLVLNRFYQPVRVTRARRALTLLFAGSGQALDRDYRQHDFERWLQGAPGEGDEVIGTSSGPLRIPRLLLLLHYGRVPRNTMRLSRRNVYLRDDHTCQYCGQRKTPRDLNLDHVTPRSRGGKTTWENLVTSCRRCNFNKGSHSLDEAGMRLMRVPIRPNWTTAAALAAAPRHFAEWEPFLGARA
ncbi:MAG: HNH endonuclease [Myxococcales bacterium]|nr:HNH endonuclease [Myxococcales bacterium]